MQRADDQVAGLGGGDGVFDGFEVVHLAHDDDVRVFAQRGLEGGMIGDGVFADLTLGHGAVLGNLKDLDGFLHGDDVVGTFFVGHVDHGGEGRGLARADGAGDEDQTVVVVQQPFDGGGVPGQEAQLLELADVVGNQPVASGNAVFLVHETHPETVFAHFEGEAGVLFRHEVLFAFGREQTQIEPFGIFRRDDVAVDAFDLELAADKGGSPGRNVQIAAPQMAQTAEHEDHPLFQRLLVQGAGVGQTGQVLIPVDGGKVDLDLGEDPGGIHDESLASALSGGGSRIKVFDDIIPQKRVLCTPEFE